MVNSYRQMQNYVYGTLLAGCASGDLTLTSNAFTNLTVITLGSGAYEPLALQDPSTGKFEIVWVTAHASASTTVTVIRGQESTAGLSWSAGSLVANAVLLRDLLSLYAAGSYPTDGHYGMRLVDTVSGVTYTNSPNGWLAPIIGKAASNTPNIAGTATTAGAQLQVASGSFSVATNGTGDFTVVFATPFPTACVSVVAAPTSVAGVTTSFLSSGATASQWTGRAKNAAANVASATVVGTYIAVGY